MLNSKVSLGAGEHRFNRATARFRLLLHFAGEQLPPWVRAEPGKEDNRPAVS
jgi:hypothetical protein